MKRIVANFFLCFLMFTPNLIFAQADSLIMKNGDVIVGEFKDMDRGVLGIETDYSDSDFKIEWLSLLYVKYNIKRTRCLTRSRFLAQKCLL